jgi:hypothetical protein
MKEHSQDIFHIVQMNNFQHQTLAFQVKQHCCMLFRNLHRAQARIDVTCFEHLFTHGEVKTVGQTCLFSMTEMAVVHEQYRNTKYRSPEQVIDKDIDKLVYK